MENNQGPVTAVADRSAGSSPVRVRTSSATQSGTVSDLDNNPTVAPLHPEDEAWSNAKKLILWALTTTAGSPEETEAAERLEGARGPCVGSVARRSRDNIGR